MIINIHPSAKLENVCAKPDERPGFPALENAYVVDDILWVSDGRLLVGTPLPEGAPAGPVPKSAIKMSRRDDGNMILNESEVIVDGWTSPREQDGDYPDVREVVPDSEKFSHGKIGLRGDYLKKIVDSLGGGDLTIQLQPPSDDGRIYQAIKVVNSEGAFAILMPLRDSP